MSARAVKAKRPAKQPIDEILDFGDSEPHPAPTGSLSLADGGVNVRLLRLVKQMREIQERVDRLLSKI